MTMMETNIVAIKSVMMIMTIMMMMLRMNMFKRKMLSVWQWQMKKHMMVITIWRKRIIMMSMMIMMNVIMMMTIKMKMIRRKWWASDSDKCEGRSVACPPLSRVYCTLPCIFHFTSLYFCACTFLYLLYFTFLFILQMFFPTFVNCTRLMYLHCTFISMSLSLSDKVRLKKYVTKWFYFKCKKMLQKYALSIF